MRDAELDKLWMKKLGAVAHAVMAIDAGAMCKAIEGGYLVSIKVLFPVAGRLDCLVVAKAATASEDYVGFVGGPDLATTLLTWRKKEAGEGLRFRVDEPLQ